MTACTSPALMVRSTPLRICLPSTPAWRFLISRMGWLSVINLRKIVPAGALSHAPLEAHPEQFLRLHRKFHREFLEHLLAEAVHDHVHRVLRGDAPLVAIENLVLADL